MEFFIFDLINIHFFRENILKTAKALVEDTKTLVAGAASNQEQLAQAAQCAVKTITRLADVVKLGAAALGSEQPDAQVRPDPSSYPWYIWMLFLAMEILVIAAMTFFSLKVYS